MPNTGANYYAGNNGAATINGTALDLVRWSVNPTATVVAFINSLTGKHPARLPTFDDGGRFTVVVDFNQTTYPFSGSFSIRPGSILTNVLLYINLGANLKWQFPSAIVEGTPEELELAGKVMTSIVCLADGPYAPPGQAVA